MSLEHYSSRLSADELASLDAFTARVSLAAEVARPRPRYQHIRQLARRAGECAAREDWALSSPLVDLATTTVAHWDCPPATLRLLYEVSFWLTSPNFDPTHYFTVGQVARGRSWIEIRSAGLYGGNGLIVLHARSAHKMFATVSGCDAESYCHWAEADDARMGSSTGFRLWRMDGYFNSEDDYEEFEPGIRGQLRLNVDVHPSSGRLDFGEPLHEAEQLAALLRLKPLADQVLHAAIPTAEEKRLARERVDIARRLTKHCFLPGSGYCSTCGSDITANLNLTTPQDVSDTGCRACGASWCD